MFNKKTHILFTFLIFGFIIFLFSYFRLKPIYFQTVGYTYDQGRDFLKASEIILNKDITFIGPTTGIVGIYHGAWWYYILAITFVVTKGAPIGFYFMNFLVQLGGLVVFFSFLKRKFGILTASILALIVTTSPFFIFSSIFIGNNVFAIPSMLILLTSTYLVLKNKTSVDIGLKNKKVNISMYLLAGLALGYVAEFEFAFGLMLIPSYLFLIFVFQKWRHIKAGLKNNLLFFSGILVPFMPRLLFELKNSFPQTRLLFNFFINPSIHTPKPYDQIFRDRIEVFTGFYNGLFLSDSLKYIFLFCLISMVMTKLFSRKLKLNFVFIFLFVLFFSLFGISTLYKDTFWSYYFDGIQYLILILIALIFGKEADFGFLGNLPKYFLLISLILFGTGKVLAEIKQPIAYDGLRVQSDIVNYILSNQNDKTRNYCLRIYTPPVFSYTYDYLFLYHHNKFQTQIAQKEWVDNTCWFILEKDDFKERKQKWIDDNIPNKNKVISKKLFKDVDVFKIKAL